METGSKNILISGAGIAGLTLGYWLKQYGFKPTIIEKHQALRGGGYMIDFWGTGFTVAEKMHLKAALEKEHYHIPEITFVNEKNQRTGGFNIYKLRELIHFRHFNLLRSGLAKVLYQEIKNDVPFIWGNSITKIEQNAGSVQVQFEDGQQKEYDLVIGADGLHSVVRKLVFGKEAQFEKFLGYYVASFTMDNYLKKGHDFRSYTVPGKQASIYNIAPNKLAAFFIFRQKENFSYNHHRPEEAQNIIRKRFENAGWECRELLAGMDRATDFYFDAVSQIKLSSWHQGRVALVGDACQCVSLLAGEGAALAMAGAYVLAGELKASRGDHATAFSRYHSIMKPEILMKQEMALKFAASFVPETKAGIWLRNLVTDLMFLPFVSKWFLKQFLLDSLKLKAY